MSIFFCHKNTYKVSITLIQDTQRHECLFGSLLCRAEIQQKKITLHNDTYKTLPGRESLPLSVHFDILERNINSSFTDVVLCVNFKQRGHLSVRTDEKINGRMFFYIIPFYIQVDLYIVQKELFSQFELCIALKTEINGLREKIIKRIFMLSKNKKN